MALCTNRFRVGMGDIVQYCFHLEHKDGYLVKIAARNQFFWSPDGQVHHRRTRDSR